MVRDVRFISGGRTHSRLAKGRQSLSVGACCQSPCALADAAFECVRGTQNRGAKHERRVHWRRAKTACQAMIGMRSRTSCSQVEGLHAPPLSAKIAPCDVGVRSSLVASSTALHAHARTFGELKMRGEKRVLKIFS
ncbi:hypothetical protein [Massilia sp. TSP1-1-2]|uniref:hypothetical protein n=1 Tax=Massilia sp. TSP1-1-2 TaxID=2804649 RepID=UPI003CF90302